MKNIIDVNGMMCSHCKKAVEEAIEKIDGVNKVLAEPSKNIVTVEGEYNLEKIKETIESIGFELA